MRIGLYGGTFDPIHLGHLAVAGEVHLACDLDLVLFVPAAQSPLRTPPHASGLHRLRMCELAVQGRPEFAVTDVELHRPPPSYTVDTVKAIQRGRPGSDLFLIVGADALEELRTWRDVEGILALAHIIAVTRPGYHAAPPADLLAAAPAARERILIHGMSPMDISASEVRDLVARGGSIDAHVPPGVRDYILRYGLYRSVPADRTGPI